MLYIDQPVGVGFSPSFDDFYVNNSDFAASDFHSFLLQFYEIYPYLKTNQVYITGESYAGHYVPRFAYEILTSPDLTSIV